MSELYAEDLPVGRRFELGTHAVSAEEIKEFARAWDPLPFHVDEEAASASPFGGLVASGAHTFAIHVRLISDALVRRLAVIAGRGVLAAAFLQPVRPGMSLSGTTTILEQRLGERGSGTIIIRGELRDAEGTPVMTLDGELIVRMRPAADAE